MAPRERHLARRVAATAPGRGWFAWGPLGALSLLAVPALAATPHIVPGLLGPQLSGVLDDCAPINEIRWGMIGGRCSARTPFFTAIPAPLFALFMYASCMALGDGGGGAGVGLPVYDLLASPVAQGLGRIGLQVHPAPRLASPRLTSPRLASRGV